MRIKTTNIIWVSIALIGLSQGENIRGSMAKGNQIRQQQSEFSDRIRINRDESRQAEKLSKIAVNRYKNNCILVIDKATGIESYFVEGQPITDRRLKRPLRTGALICNRLGDTAVVGGDGTVTDIARIITSDLPTIKKLLEKEKKNGSSH